MPPRPWPSSRVETVDVRTSVPMTQTIDSHDGPVDQHMVLHDCSLVSLFRLWAQSSRARMSFYKDQTITFKNQHSSGHFCPSINGPAAVHILSSWTLLTISTPYPGGFPLILIKLLWVQDHEPGRLKWSQTLQAVSSGSELEHQGGSNLCIRTLFIRSVRCLLLTGRNRRTGWK